MSQILLRSIVETLPRYRYRFADEAQLQAGIADVLVQAGIPFEREHVAGPRDRFDFLVPGGIVIEAKTQGSLSQALSQVRRYAARPDVSAVVLVACRFWATVAPVDELYGKPVRIVRLRGDAF